MARKPMVTRTIKTTYVSVMCVDTATAEVCTKEVTLPRTYKDENAVLKAVKPVIEVGTIKAVAIAHTEEREALYGMSESEFIANAKVLPPRTPGSGADEGEDEAETSGLLED